MKTSTFSSSGKGAFLALFFLGGCSLINSFDALKERPAATGGTTGTGGISGGGSGGSGTGGAGTGGIQDVNTDVFVPLADTDGIIVAYESKSTPATSRVWVLDASNGGEITREDTPTQVLIAHNYQDDLWYFFEQGSSASEVNLRVRQLYGGGRWVDRGVPVAVPVPAKSMGVLAGRVAYLSKADATITDPAQYTLTVLDTSNPDDVKVAAGTTARVVLTDYATDQKQDSVAAPSTTGVGGTVTVILQNAAGQLRLLRVSVTGTGVQIDPPSTTPPTSVGTVDTTGGQAGFVTSISTGHVVGVLPPATVPTLNLEPNCDNTPTGEKGIANSFSNNAAHSAIGTSPQFDFVSRRVQGTAFDHCHQIAFASTLLNDFALWAIPLQTTGTVFKLCLGEGTGGLLFDTFNNRVLRLSTSGILEAYDIDATTTTAPSVALQPSFALPTGIDLSSGVFDIRRRVRCN